LICAQLIGGWDIASLEAGRLLPRQIAPNWDRSSLYRPPSHGMIIPSHVERATRMTNKEANESQQQPYDRAMKSLLEDHAAEMIAELVPESRLIEERNAELTRLNL